MCRHPRSPPLIAGLSELGSNRSSFESPVYTGLLSRACHHLVGGPQERTAKETTNSWTSLGFSLRGVTDDELYKVLTPVGVRRHLSPTSGLAPDGSSTLRVPREYAEEPRCGPHNAVA